jgi:hypothetical protein
VNDWVLHVFPENHVEDEQERDDGLTIIYYVRGWGWNLHNPDGRLVGSGTAYTKAEAQAAGMTAWEKR